VDRDGVVLGIDLATSTARCVVVSLRDGRVLASAAATLPTPVRGPGGSSTQEATYPDVALALVGRVIRELGPAAGSVRAVATTGTSGTVLAAHAHGVPVSPALLYDDLSGASLSAAHGLPAGSMLARMAMVARTAGRVARVVTTVDTVNAVLVDGPVDADTSHTLKAGVDPLARTWPIAAADLGLGGLLPGLVPPAAVLGVVARTVAIRLGLPAGVLVVSGMTDGCTGQVATGAVDPGRSVGVLGTTLVLKAVSSHRVESADGAVYSHYSPDGDWWPGGASSCGAGGLSGLRGDDLARLDGAAASRGPASVVCYPLVRPGERFPVADPALHAVWSGEPRDDVEAHRALLEGVAFVERLGLETLAHLGAPSRRHVLAGGGTRSDTWNRLRATVLTGHEVSVAARLGSAVGAAVLAALALEPGATLAAVTARLVPPARPVAPVEWESETLESSYTSFLDLLSRHTDVPLPPRSTTSEGSADHG